MLMQTIANLLRSASDCQIKIRAFELTLEQEAPEKSEVYRAMLANLYDQRAFEINLLGFATMQEKLRQG